MYRSFVIGCFLLTLLGATVTARAAEAESSPLADTPKPALQFDFFADETPVSTPGESAVQQSAAARRRLMLQIHQILGITTWVAMGTTVVIGQLNYNDLYGGGPGTRGYKKIHKPLSYGTAGLFALTGAFALLAPEPFEKPWQFDTALVHRLATIGATIGMVAQVSLGILTRMQAGAGNPQSRDHARAHQIIGYATFGLLTVAGTTWLF